VITPIIEIRISGHHPVARISTSIFADLPPASVEPSPTSIGRASSRASPSSKISLADMGTIFGFSRKIPSVKEKYQRNFSLL
jgi:hypothetical protein